MSRRRATRIQPFRPYRSRRRTLGLLIVSLLVLVVAFSAWGQRSEHFFEAPHFSAGLDRELTEVEIESTAGPITVGMGQQTSVEVSSSWLVRRPAVETSLKSGDESGARESLENQLSGGFFPISQVERSSYGGGQLPASRFAVRASCETRFPCRSALDIKVGSGQRLIARSSGALSVEDFDGVAMLEALDSAPIILGRTTGRLVARGGSGGITGYGISSHDVAVHSRQGRVELSFLEPPITLSVVAGTQPVMINVPLEDYQIWINGAHPLTKRSDAIVDRRLTHAPGAKRSISIDSNGPISLQVGERNQ